MSVLPQENEGKTSRRYDGRKNLIPAVKGQVLNPNGRPKIPEQVSDMLQAATPEAVKQLVHMLSNSESEKIRVQCAQIILDRTYGRAAQAVDVRVTDVAQTHLQILQELQRRRGERIAEGNGMKTVKTVEGTSEGDEKGEGERLGKGGKGVSLVIDHENASPVSDPSETATDATLVIDDA